MLCACGCGKKTNYEVGDYYPNTTVKVVARFLPNHDKRLKQPWVIDPRTGCWNWTGYVSKAGYARMLDNGVCRNAHRVLWERKYGSIPSDMKADHLCRNPRCVNLDHIEIVSNAENTRRGARAKLTMQDARVIRQLRKTKTARELAEQYSVSTAAIFDIWYGRRWVA